LVLVLPAALPVAPAVETGVVMTTVPEVTVVTTALDCVAAADEAADEAMALAEAELYVVVEKLQRLRMSRTSVGGGLVG
jgi:hypothetical protein